MLGIQFGYVALLSEDDMGRYVAGGPVPLMSKEELSALNRKVFAAVATTNPEIPEDQSAHTQVSMPNIVNGTAAYTTSMALIGVERQELTEDWQGAIKGALKKDFGENYDVDVEMHDQYPRPEDQTIEVFIMQNSL